MYEVTEAVVTERPTAVLRGRIEVSELESWVGPALRRVRQVVTDAGLHPVGPPFTRFHPVPGTASTVDVEAGLPLLEPLPATACSDDVEASRLPGGPVAVTVRQGPYQAFTPAFEAVEAWMERHHAECDGTPWENFLDAPAGEPSGWRARRTQIVQPYRAA